MQWNAKAKPQVLWLKLLVRYAPWNIPYRVLYSEHYVYDILQVKGMESTI